MAPSRDTSAFGQLLRQARTTAALSQDELAERAGLSTRAISDLERGLHRAPRPETVRLLADALQLDADARAALARAARPRLPGGRDARSRPLPAPLTRLVGRERELASLTLLLRDTETRLLTLTGPGGSGKTRLAIAAAEHARVDFPDGIVFVDLAPLADPMLVPDAIAQTVGMVDPGASDPIEGLRAALAGQRLLLVLDNFEHLLAAGPAVSELLRALPALSVLATSREALRLRGEREFQVPPLALPDPRHSNRIEALAASPAVALFVERARDALAGFALSDANAAAVAEICQRLDGLPLALELAAAQLRAMPLTLLRARLEHALPFLIRGPRDAPARQQSLRATITWSHDLLSHQEQLLLRRLGVFVGGWTLAAAEVVATPGDDSDVLAVLTSLVEKHLVRLAEASLTPRYRMLETVREFALEQLASCGETEDMRGRHAAWLRALVESLEPEAIGGAIDRAGIRLLDEELPNLRAAVTWLLATGDASTALRILAATEDYWIQRAHYGETRGWLMTALAAAPDAPAVDRAVAHHELTFANSVLGHREDAITHASLGLAAARTSGEPSAIGLTLYDVGLAWEYAGEIERAIPAYEEAIPLLHDAGNAYMHAAVLQQLGDKLCWRGDFAAGVPMLEEAIAVMTANDWSYSATLGHGRLAHVALVQGDLARAAAGFVRCLTGDGTNERIALDAINGIAGVALALGQPERAARLLGAVDAAWQARGFGRPAFAIHDERIVTATRGLLGEAAFAHARSAGRSLPAEDALAEALTIAQTVTDGVS